MARNNTQQLDEVREAHLWLRNITCERLCGYPPEGSSRDEVVNCTIFQTKIVTSESSILTMVASTPVYSPSTSLARTSSGNV